MLNGVKLASKDQLEILLFLKKKLQSSIFVKIFCFFIYQPNVQIVETEALAGVTEVIDSELWLFGNWNLISLNLSRNELPIVSKLLLEFNSSFLREQNRRNRHASIYTSFGFSKDICETPWSFAIANQCL